MKHISALNCNLMALQYPILFPYGDKSYHLGIKYVVLMFTVPQLMQVCQSFDQLDDDGNIIVLEDVRASHGEVSMLE